MDPGLIQRAIVLLAAGELLLARLTGGPLPWSEVTLWAVGWTLLGALVAIPRLGRLPALLAALLVATTIVVPPLSNAWGATGVGLVGATLAAVLVILHVLGVDLALLAILTLLLSVGAACLPGIAVPPVGVMVLWMILLGVLAAIADRPGGAWVAGALAALLGGMPTPRLPRGEVGPDVVVVTVDALRADAVPWMVSWHRLAARGRAYEGWAPAPWTLPSLATMWTGVPPHAHGAGRIDTGFTPLERGPTTLAERLARQGWRTVALSSGNPFTGHRYGLLRGFVEAEHPWDPTAAPLPRARSRHAPPRPLFARVLPRPPERWDAEALVDRALARLAAPDGPRFVWLHLMDVHLPWTEAPCRPLTLTSPGVRPRLVDDPWWVGDEGRACLEAGYRGAVSRVDRALERLLDGLDLDRTIVVLAADHGEALGDAGVEHGHTLDPVVMRVPLVVSAPGRVPPEVPGPVSLGDLPPTLEALLGLPVTLPGLDLTRAKVAGPTVLSSPLYGPARTAVVDGPWMLEVVGGTMTLRRWAEDAGDRSEDHPEVVARLRRWAL